MRTSKTLDERLKKRLQKAVNTYGMQKPIIDVTGIPSKTLKRLAEEGTALASVVDKIVLYFQQESPPPPPAINMVCEAYNISPEEITARKNFEARQVAAYILSLQRSPKLTLTEIADKLKYKDHTGVFAAINTIADRIDVELILKKKVFALQARLSGITK